MRRAPVILQHAATECGAACLAMVLSCHGRRTAIQEVTDQLQVGRDGLSALAIVAAAEQYGLRAKAFSLEPADLARVPMPAVIHWEFRHFLVVERWAPGRVDVIDPAQGRRRLTAEEFDAGFTGVLLAFEPAPGFRRARSGAAHAWRREFLRTLLLRRKGLLAQVLAASALLQILGLGLATMFQLVVDRILPHGGERLLTLAGVAVLAAAVTQFAVAYLRSVLLVALRARTDGEVTENLVSHLVALPYRYFTTRGKGDLVNRSASVVSLRETLTGQVLATLLDGPLALVFLVLVVLADPFFGGFLLLLVLVQAAILLGTARRVGDLTRRELVALAATQSRLLEAIGGIETLKASGAEPLAMKRWSEQFALQLHADVRGGLVKGLVDSALTAIRYLAPLGLLWAGAWRVLDGSMSLGTLLALNSVAAAALTPIGSLLTAFQNLQEAGAHFDRLSDILATEPERSAGIEVLRLRGAIELRRVSFRHDPRGPWVLREVSLTVRPGQKVALVGASGSGKTTLARLLLALHTPTEGEIRYDGVPAAELNRRSLRRQFGVVTQEPSLFTGTIKENIAFNDPEASQRRIAEAAELACLHDEIVAMPMGYETLLVEGGGLSGGQRQRLALARALLPHPRVLLLDEATSQLDAATEAEIEARLAGLTQTRIVIAHRLSTVKDADLILVMDGGRVIEHGTHAELLAREGRYARLVAAQMAGVTT
ncbi:peptidase domain-containing ABC transporter [Herbidospora galbida]|uniref:Peptidase domain-containing ABC transporter n=1 Tax=Herbidospora galbida TaxID=2575442 RepID=A0A4U3MFD4_9ACTN|nr:peptidase domain-containing ABC transporter [Herbidospora galbida]TKK87985.1 peptidase domain-containing ABC transporter [Herbidospora galbida]